MKIRHPALIKATAFAGAWAIRFWMSTLHYRCRSLGVNLVPTQKGFSGRYIYAFWHENFLLPAYHYGRHDVRVLVSQHADGRMIGEVCRHLRMRLVHGSTTRGGVEAMRRMLRLSRTAHLVITPDGPRGPRRVVQMGAIYLAAKTELPIVPVGIGYERPWRLKSWDRFAIPRPWSRSTLIFGNPIHVPSNQGRDRLLEFRYAVEQALNEVSESAEDWANAGHKSFAFKELHEGLREAS